jgi:hypothetical protein
MPLAFRSLSHGTIAFGFFNIDSDMLLLENYFFFADRFCSSMVDLAGQNGRAFSVRWDAHCINDPAMVGDLMGAIHGVRFTGFIGELYKRFPFPLMPEDFRQKSEGSKTRRTVLEIICRYASETSMDFDVDKDGREAKIGPFRFRKDSFQELIRYVWRGGYPRWAGEIRPKYVREMREAIEKSPLGILAGISFDGA